MAYEEKAVPTNEVSKETPFLRFFRSCEIDAEVEQYSNSELADALLNVIWAKLDINSTESSLVSEAINRLRMDFEIANG